MTEYPTLPDGDPDIEARHVIVVYDDGRIGIRSEHRWVSGEGLDEFGPNWMIDPSVGVSLSIAETAQLRGILCD